MADFPPVIKLVFEDNSCTVDVYIIFVRNLNAPNEMIYLYNIKYRNVFEGWNILNFY